MNNKYKILLVEDEQNISTLVMTMLETAGYQVIPAGTCAMAKTLFISYCPDMDGMTFLKEVRKNSLTPIIVLSARTNERDKVLALDSGANDYVTKPFGAAELLARIRSALRNCSHSADSGKLPGGRFSVQDLEILYDARQVFIKGREIKLTQTEYNIVALLSEHCGKMMTYSAIIKGVWGYPDEGSVKKLQVNMANIRKKFGVKPGEATYITNELGVGYRMNSD